MSNPIKAEVLFRNECEELAPNSGISIVADDAPVMLSLPGKYADAFVAYINAFDPDAPSIEPKVLEFEIEKQHSGYCHLFMVLTVYESVGPERFLIYDKLRPSQLSEIASVIAKSFSMVANVVEK